MKTDDFNYDLPQELIAQEPVKPRDHSRLLVVERNKKQETLQSCGQAKNKPVQQLHFYDILDYLNKGDLIVWNNSKVFKARLFGQLVSNTGQVLRGHDKPVEIFLVRSMENEGVWKVLAKPGRHVRMGCKVVFADDFECEVLLKEPEGTILVQFPDSAEVVRQKANKYGTVPVPPYVKDEKHELESYQTVYADDRHEGSVAAPTAGFHFTPELIKKLKNKGVKFAEVTLHVGLGTFLPVKSERVEDHVMHSEWVELTTENIKKINFAKTEGRRVVAVGTTTVRTLEGVAKLQSYEVTKQLKKYSGDINIFIKPGFEFQIVDAMITNFHLPKSTLLMLVSAFVHDREFTLSCYEEAVKEKYRFYSFGDAMFIR
ncbi:tRNA preQ1(34) S-adenosylmethionine ribosyltransferase-isomerase QueA [Patescibacteria group bacterium]|nr:tRNA preQ1(34) S-adenosylmethionine ribosyltransferase-isomerase QueA [Patescibacteria group bacterium]MBU1895665.1 tRNA preQ1(34) S-adenosylmethionine ribosyltransferase-isomerase QueA [Patescibacteria group bacterium]